MNSIKDNLISSKVYLREVLLLNVILLCLIIFFFNASLLQVIITLLIFVTINFFVLNAVGNRRNGELQNIKSIIHSIRMNEYSSPDEIKLDSNLQGIQEEIKAMFLRTQNDIKNLKRLEQVRTEFLGNVSHELRTPIFAIQGFLETLLDGAIDDKKVNRSFVEKAFHHSQNLNNLLNDLIDISMIESREMRLSFRYFNINELLLQIIHEYKPQAEKKYLELILLPVNENLKLYGDRARLKQVFDNLIQNAIKYTETGKIEIHVNKEDKYVEIIISDTGIGIPQKDLYRIFERFYRVDKGRSREVGGTGLGLAIVKHIVEAHNSKVVVESILGKGSQFSFKLKK